MTLSDTKQISWKLNDLLEAGKKAKAFASNPADDEGSGSDNALETFALTTYESPSIMELSEALSTEELILSEETTEKPDLSEDEGEEEALEIETDIPLSFEDNLEAMEESDIYKQRIQEARDSAFKEGYAKGLEEGKVEWSDSTLLLNEFLGKLRTESEDKAQFFDPLKKLSLHIAKHLVRGELSLSGLAVERLVLESLSLIEKNSKGIITVYLSPNDSKRYKEVAAMNDRLDLQDDPSLSSGSVRLTFEESAVEDLIENRLSSLSKLILNQSDGWKVKNEDSEYLHIKPKPEAEIEIFDGEIAGNTSSQINERRGVDLETQIEDGELLDVTDERKESENVDSSLEINTKNASPTSKIEPGENIADGTRANVDDNL